MYRRSLLASALVAGALSASGAAAQSCKPDVSQLDKISKKQIDQWNQQLTSTGFLAAALMDNDVTVTAMMGRYGDETSLSLVLQKQEENLTRVAFESQFRAAKGDQFALGFKDGPPMSFVAKEVSNQSKAATFANKLVTTVVLVANLPDDQLAAAREALTKRQVDAVRLGFSSGQIDKGIDPKNAKRLMEKFTCFYQFLDKRGVTVAGGSAPAAASPALIAAAGTYDSKRKSTDHLTLATDGNYALQEGGKDYSGSFTLDGSAITLLIDGRPSKGKLVDNTFVDGRGTIWDKRAEEPKLPSPTSAPAATAAPAPTTALTIDQVIKMAAAKLPDDVIISTIKTSGTKFTLSADDLIKLKTAGVSDEVIRAMAK